MNKETIINLEYRHVEYLRTWDEPSFSDLTELPCFLSFLEKLYRKNYLSSYRYAYDFSDHSKFDELNNDALFEFISFDRKGDDKEVEAIYNIKINLSHEKYINNRTFLEKYFTASITLNKPKKNPLREDEPKTVNVERIKKVKPNVRKPKAKRKKVVYPKVNKRTQIRVRGRKLKSGMFKLYNMNTGKKLSDVSFVGFLELEEGNENISFNKSDFVEIKTPYFYPRTGRFVGLVLNGGHYETQVVECDTELVEISKPVSIIN